jgi:hypothetical protein
MQLERPPTLCATTNDNTRHDLLCEINPAALNACLERTKRLQQEDAELRKREALLLEQFVRWAYNAASRGLTVEFLNRALPPTNRTGNATSGRRFQ